MKKSVLALAVLGAFAANNATASEAASVSGFIDVVYTISDDEADGGNDSVFSAEGEVNFTATPADGVTVRVDADLNMDPGVDEDSGRLEQAFFAWGAADNVTILGGLFNNPIGAEAEDAPDMWGTNHGVVYNILDHQTAADGDNVAGLAGAFGLGPATLTIGFLNDIGGNADDSGDAVNSIAAVVNFTPMDGLDLELGHVTQEAGAENVTNFNVGYTGIEGLALGLDYLAADEIVDAAYEISAKYTLPVGVGFGLRLEAVEWAADGAEDSERTTFHISYAVASNLTAILEVADGDEDNPGTDVTGIKPEGVTTLELIATF